MESDENSENIEQSPQNISTTQEQENDSRFVDGQKIKMVNVRFPGQAKCFPFLIGKKNFSYGQKVIAMSDRGMAVGYINSFPYEVTFDKSMLPIKSISKVATQKDIEEEREHRSEEKKAEIICLKLIEKYKLDMNLTHVEFMQFGKKAVFYFTAPERVDFRGLVKDLVSELKMRIELRQISVRDRSAALGSVSVCGRQNCCSSFLKGYGNVSIKMAKNQNLALIPNKINGICGQIKCCMKYEDQTYINKRKKLPKEGHIIKVKNGDIGKVTNLHILREEFEMLTKDGKFRRYSISEYDPSEKLPENFHFPERFENIVNELQTLIGVSLNDDGQPKIKNNLSLQNNDQNENLDNNKKEKPQLTLKPQITNRSIDLTKKEDQLKNTQHNALKEISKEEDSSDLLKIDEYDEFDIDDEFDDL